MLIYGCLVILCLLKVNICENLTSCIKDFEPSDSGDIDYNNVFNGIWGLHYSFNTEPYTSNLRCVQAIYSEDKKVPESVHQYITMMHTGIKNSTNERISILARGSIHKTFLRMRYTEDEDAITLTVLDKGVGVILYQKHEDSIGCRIWVFDIGDTNENVRDWAEEVLKNHGLAFTGYVPTSQENCELYKIFVPKFLGKWYLQSSYKTEEVDGDLRCVYLNFFDAKSIEEYHNYYGDIYMFLHEGIDNKNNKWINFTGGFHFVEGITKETNSAFTLKFFYLEDDYKPIFDDNNPLIFVLGTDYTSYAVIKEDNFHQYGYRIWLLSREQFPPKDFYDNCKKILHENGIEYKGFIAMDQKNCSLQK